MKKKYIIVISIIIVYFLGLFLFIGVNNIKNEQKEATIIVDTETIWQLEKNKWINVSEIIKDDIYNVFLDNKNLGKFYLEKQDNWILYDLDRKQYKYDLGSFLAIKANYEINLMNFNAQEISNKKYVNKVLSDNKISATEELTVNRVYQIDIDTDGIKENIYAISNAFAKQTSPKDTFSIVFMEKDNKIYYLYNKVEKNDGLNGCKPYINTVIDLDNDKIYEIIVSCGYFSTQKRSDMLYKFENEQFKMIIDNK